MRIGSLLPIPEESARVRRYCGAGAVFIASISAGTPSA
jgi:hypothetical protein